MIAALKDCCPKFLLDPDPFFSSKPSITYPSANSPSFTVSNCQFRYEGQPTFTYTYILYNADNIVIKEMPATIRELGNDNYIFNTLVINSYQNIASYYRCQISAQSLAEPIVSLKSDFIDVKREQNIFIENSKDLAFQKYCYWGSSKLHQNSLYLGKSSSEN